MARAVQKKKTAPKAKKAKPAKKVVKKTPKPAKKPVKKPTPKKILKMKPQKKSVTVKAATPVTVKVAAKAAPQKGALREGSATPDFSMPATMLGTVSLSTLKGKPFVLYFYPKDDTSGCTAEACEFRNTLSIFNNLGVAIIGISKDSIESHEKFSRKYSLTFPLASDESGAVCEKFGTWVQKSMYGRSYMGIERATFLIDSKGIIRNIWHKVSVSGHVEEVKKAAEAL